MKKETAQVLLNVCDRTNLYKQLLEQAEVSAVKHNDKALMEIVQKIRAA